MATVERLCELLDELDDANAECDGVARLVSTVLSRHGIEHQVYAGTIRRKSESGGADTVMGSHHWVECGQLRIDYRARMWLGTDACVPHGVHSPLRYPLIAYVGTPIYLEPLSDQLFSIVQNKDGYDFSAYFPDIAQAGVIEPGSKTKGPRMG